MSEQTAAATPETGTDAPAETAGVTEQTTEQTEKQAAEQPAQTPVKKGALLVIALLVLSSLWYLLADRFTPYTSQARVQGFVVGVAPKVAGLVTKVWVKNNQKVDKDQPLFQIDPSQYEIAVKRARSDLDNVRSQIDASSSGIESARANLRMAEAKLLKSQQDADRQEILYKEDPGTISVRRLEIGRASLEEARARVAASQSEVQRAIDQKGGDDDANAKLKSALSTLEKAELDLSNTLVKASTRGIITDLRAEVGQYAGAGAAVMTLIGLNDVWVNAEFTENNLGHVKVGSPVEIVFDALPGEVFVGSVRSIGLGISTGQAPAPGSLPSIQNNRDWLRQSQRFPVIIDFERSQMGRLLSQLRIGGQAEVIAYTEDHGLLRLIGELYIRFMALLSYAY
jgi:multidrug resistance efflux pump